jgi:hypothetical protein
VSGDPVRGDPVSGDPVSGAGRQPAAEAVAYRAATDGPNAAE